MFATSTKRALLYSLLGILIIHPALAADPAHTAAGTSDEKTSQTPRPDAPETEPLPKTPAELVDKSSSGTTEKSLVDAIEKLSSAKTPTDRDQAAKELVTLLGPIALKLFVKNGKVDVNSLAKVLRLDPEAENGPEAIAALKDALKDFDPNKTDPPPTTEQQGPQDPGNVPSFDGSSGGFNGNSEGQFPFGNPLDPNNPNFNPALAQQQLDPTNPNFNPALAELLDPNRRNRRNRNNRNNDNTSTSNSNSNEEGDDNKGQQQTPSAPSGGSPSGGGGKGDGVKPVEVPKPSAPPQFSAPQAGGEPQIDSGLAQILRGGDISDPKWFERVRGEFDDMAKQVDAHGKAMIDEISQLAKGFAPKQWPSPDGSTQAKKWSKNGPGGGGGGGFVGGQTGINKRAKKPRRPKRRGNQEPTLQSSSISRELQ